jgi:hypothetical protein
MCWEVFAFAEDTMGRQQSFDTRLPSYSVCCLESGFVLGKELKPTAVPSINDTGFNENS